MASLPQPDLVTVQHAPVDARRLLGSQRADGVLVIGGEYRALGAVRSLGRRNVPVCVLAEAGDRLAGVSRYTQEAITWPPGGDSTREQFLIDLARSRGMNGWAVIPSGDETAAFLARRHEALSRWFRLTVQPWEVIRWTYDKRLTYTLAPRLEVAVPRTAWPGTHQALCALDVPFPAVLKPAIKESVNSLTTAKVWLVANQSELERRFAEASELIDPALLMVQEVVPGGGATQFSFAALCRDGCPVASVTARRTRQYPAQFGRASTFVETVECSEVVEPSLRLLAELRYTGLIELEYKRDVRDGVFKLLDMNPRLWGWHTLCIEAGVDFPWLLWLLVNGDDVPACRARPGVGWLRVSTDTPMALRELLSGRLTLREYRRSFRRPRAAPILAWDDPLPGLAEFPLLAHDFAKRLRQGRPV
jgi:predicted ATP-grasp superfamily ATP-dependent carboligase